MSRIPNSMAAVSLAVVAKEKSLTMLKSICALAVLVGGLSQTGVAHAAWTSGSACTVTAGSPFVAVSQVPYGATNKSTSSAITVDCPLQGTNGSVTAVSMLAFDRNGSSNVICTLHAWDRNGNYITSIQLSTTNGGAGAGLQNVVRDQQIISNAFIWSAQCSIPNATVQNGVNWESHIIGFGIN
jgi:hypothetical protein